MILTIDTTLADEISVSLSGGGRNIIKKVKAPRRQAEKLLPLVVKIMAAAKISWPQVKEVRVQNQGGSFTSLRIGVLTANALAYALGVPAISLDNKDGFSFPGGRAVKPRYQSEPNIGKKKAATC